MDISSGRLHEKGKRKWDIHTSNLHVKMIKFISFFTM